MAFLIVACVMVVIATSGWSYQRGVLVGRQQLYDQIVEGMENEHQRFVLEIMGEPSSDVRDGVVN